MTTIFSFTELDQLIAQLHHKKIVIAGGCFDLLHLGHITFLKNAKAKGDLLIVLLESDKTIKKLKGKGRPIHTQDVRAQILSELKSVDFVLKLAEFTSDNEYDALIEKLKPEIIATTKGDKYDFHKKRQAKKIGAKLVYVAEPIKDHSTSKIIKKAKLAN